MFTDNDIVKKKKAVGRHNSKLNREIGKTEANVYIMFQILKKMSESVSFEIK